jgi:hypothetical protein
MHRRPAHQRHPSWRGALPVQPRDAYLVRTQESQAAPFGAAATEQGDDTTFGEPRLEQLRIRVRQPSRACNRSFHRRSCSTSAPATSACAASRSWASSGTASISGRARKRRPGT